VDREQAIAAIAEAAKQARPRRSRALWLAALVVGVASTIGFVLVLVASPAPAPTHAAGTAQPAADRGLGFATGLVIGLGTGVALGVALGRRARGTGGAPAGT
jgi:hypothetical protein